jgi:hypothetical protein
MAKGELGDCLYIPVQGLLGVYLDDGAKEYFDVKKKKYC